MSEQPERVPVRGRLFREPEYVAVKHRATPAGITATEIAPWLSTKEQRQILAALKQAQNLIEGEWNQGDSQVAKAIALLQSRLYPTSNNKENDHE